MFNEIVAAFYRLAKRAYWKMNGFISFVFYRRTILVLRKKVGNTDTKSEYQIHEYTANAREVTDVYKSVSRYNCYSGSDDDTRMASRLRHGLKFYAAYENGKVVAYLWIHSVRHRFFDEIGIFSRHGTNDIWLRDVYVVPDKRGQRIFGSIINAVIREYYPKTSNLYSDVMRDNKSSLKAHKHLGMDPVGSVRYTRILGRILYREINTEELEAYGYQYPQKIIFMDSDYRSFIDSNRS